jgi:hypothetical protein
VEIHAGTGLAEAVVALAASEMMKAAMTMLTLVSARLATLKMAGTTTSSF